MISDELVRRRGGGITQDSDSSPRRRLSSSASYYLLLELNQIRRAVQLHVQRRARLVLLRLRVPGEHLGTIIRQELSVSWLERRQTLQEAVLLVTRAKRHAGVGSLMQELDVHGEPGHVHRELPAGDPAVVEPGKLAILQDGRTQSEFGAQPHRKHRHRLRLADLNKRARYIELRICRIPQDIFKKDSSERNSKSFS